MSPPQPEGPKGAWQAPRRLARTPVSISPAFPWWSAPAARLHTLAIQGRPHLQAGVFVGQTHGPGFTAPTAAKRRWRPVLSLGWASASASASASALPDLGSFPRTSTAGEAGKEALLTHVYSAVITVLLPPGVRHHTGE